MPDEGPTLGEVVRRLDRIEVMLNEQGTRFVPFQAFQRELEVQAERDRRFARDLAALRQDHEDEQRDRRASQQWMVRFLAAELVAMLGLVVTAIIGRLP